MNVLRRIFLALVYRSKTQNNIEKIVSQIIHTFSRSWSESLKSIFRKRLLSRIYFISLSDVFDIKVLKYKLERVNFIRLKCNPRILRYDVRNNTRLINVGTTAKDYEGRGSSQAAFRVLFALSKRAALLSGEVEKLHLFNEGEEAAGDKKRRKSVFYIVIRTHPAVTRMCVSVRVCGPRVNVLQVGRPK